MIYQDLQLSQIPLVADFYVTAFQGEPWHDQWTLSAAIKRLTAMMSHSGAYGMVAYEENRPVAAILGYEEEFYDGPHFEIKEFWTDPQAQGKGVGSQLLQTFEARLQERGIREILLLTLHDPKTIGYYQGRSYEPLSAWTIFHKKLAQK